jgi:hypothetical protein
MTLISRMLYWLLLYGVLGGATSTILLGTVLIPLAWEHAGTTGRFVTPHGSGPVLREIRAPGFIRRAVVFQDVTSQAAVGFTIHVVDTPRWSRTLRATRSSVQFEEATGWPLPAFCCYWEWRRSLDGSDMLLLTGGIGRREWTPRPVARRWHVVPLTPIASGFLVDAAIFGACAFGVRVAVHCIAARVTVRRRVMSACCIECGYDMTAGTSAYCPECGAQHWI